MKWQNDNVFLFYETVNEHSNVIKDTEDNWIIQIVNLNNTNC